MHACLNVDEILRLLVCELVGSEANATAVSFACCCKKIREPALDGLWKTQDQLTPLLKCFPQDVWEETDGDFVSQVMKFISSTLNWPSDLTVAQENPDKNGIDCFSNTRSENAEAHSGCLRGPSDPGHSLRAATSCLQ